MSDDRKADVAKKLNIPEDKVSEQVIPVTPEIREQLKAGTLQVAPGKGSQPLPMGTGNPEVIARNFQKKIDASRRQQQRVASAANRISAPVTADDAKAAMEKSKKHPKRKTSQFVKRHGRLKRMVLTQRPAGAPSILQECEAPIKLMISQHQSPGDLIMLSAAVRDLHKTYPGLFQTCMRTPCAQLWENNPHHTPLSDKDPAAMWLAAEYPLINTSNQGQHHFIHGFRLDLERKLGLKINPGAMKGDIHLSIQERSWFSQVHEILGKDVPFWIIDAGTKTDYTNKQWEIARYQAVVDALPEVTFVQIGARQHKHEELKGDNLINLVGKTNIRQFVRLMYHAAGVITPVSFPMHLAAAVQMHPRYKRKERPCIVIAGGREPAMWEAYSNHQFLHTCGMLPCCASGGCWAARIKPLGDGNDKDYLNLCKRPVKSESGQIVPKCMDMIQVDDVVKKVHMYNDAYDFSSEDPKLWKMVPFPPLKEVEDLKAKYRDKAPEHVDKQLKAREAKVSAASQSISQKEEVKQVTGVVEVPKKTRRRRKSKPLTTDTKGTKKK
jgi:ADP-heptose:LPS heptosyltransferase